MICWWCVVVHRPGSRYSTWCTIQQPVTVMGPHCVVVVVVVVDDDGDDGDDYTVPH
jgi:hypothetical protein